MLDAANNPFISVRCRMALGLMLIPVLFLSVCVSPLYAWPQKTGMPRAQKHESRHEIDQMEEAWRNAILTSNTAAMDGLLADDFMAISASGTLQTKEQTLANLASGRVHITSLDVSDRKVRFYGKTALVTSLAEVHATTAEGNVSNVFRYTRVYAMDARGEWKIVSFEASRVRPPGEPR